MRTLLPLLLLVACQGPEATFLFESEPNSMSLDVVGEGATDSESFDWTNRGGRAELSLSLEAGTTGTVRVIVRDDSGTQVFDDEVDSDGSRSLDSVTEAGGASGTWEVTVETRRLDGEASLSLDRFEG